MSKVALHIFIAGPSKRNSSTVAFCKAACKTLFKPGNITIQTVNILEKPALADKKKILATPTITCSWNKLERRVIGELKDLDGATRAIEFLTRDMLNQ